MQLDTAQLADRYVAFEERRLEREFAGLPPMYSKYLSQSLRDRLLDMAQRPDHERLQLDAEIDLARDTVLGEARLYDLAQEAHALSVGTKEENDALALRIAAGDRLRIALDRVADLVERVVRMRNAGKESLPVHAVNMLVMQVAQIAHKTLPEEFVPEFVGHLNAIRITDQHARGTSITPDQDAREMDATIPMWREPPAEPEQETA